MKIEIERAELLAALKRAAKIVERKVTIPILAHVHLNAAGGAVAIEATDTEIWLRQDVPAKVRGKGAATLPQRELTAIVQRLPKDATIKLVRERDAATVEITAGAAAFTLPSLPAADFPLQRPRDTGAAVFELPPSDLTALLATTAYAQSTEETRYCLNGVYLHVKETTRAGPQLRAVATDGQRLALRDVALPGGAAGMPPAIVPTKAATALAAIANQVDGLRIAVTTSQIEAEADGVVLSARLIDGQFPDYDRVIPKDHPHRATLPPTVLPVADMKSHGVRLQFEGRALRLAVDNAVIDVKGRIDVAIEIEGTPPPIGVNASSLVKILDHVGGDVVVLEIGEPIAPIIFRNPDDPAALHLLMPMRV